MPRPKKENAKRRQIRLRVTEEDFQLIDIVSKEVGTTKTDFLIKSFYNVLRHFSDEDLMVFNEKLQEKIKEKK